MEGIAVVTGASAGISGVCLRIAAPSTVWRFMISNSWSGNRLGFNKI